MLQVLKHFCLHQIVRDEPVIEGRPGESLKPLDFEDLKQQLVEKHEMNITEEDVMSAAMYPNVSNWH